jgi:predicted ATPase/class 3 adenylate cyclase
MSTDRKRTTTGQAGLPTGTVSFLFTDIVDSSGKWEEFGDRMAEAVELHDRVVEAEVAAHHGFVFKTVGDGHCVAFARLTDAARAAVSLQRHLESEDFREVNGLTIRLAVHIGEAVERDGDYFGPTLNRVARLLAIGHGGQILVSAAAAQLLATLGLQDLHLVDLGLYRLRSLARPEQVSQLVGEGLQEKFPPLRSPSLFANNLPAQLTQLFGRGEIIEDVGNLVAQSRAVTLVGPGGVGKTRVALAVAAEMSELCSDGIRLVSLGEISEASMVEDIIGSSVGARGTGETQVIENIVDQLGNRKCLILLDNCEHVLEAAALAAQAILLRCPETRVLATSREALGIAGEKVYRLAPLPLPPFGSSLQPDVAQTFGSVALFVDRANASDSSFALRPDNVGSIVAICRRLDGIPLAIELAAAWVSVVSLGELSSRLDARFSLLRGGARGAAPRQQTMRALIDWSYELLSEGQRTAFRTFAVFSNGWTAEAAEQICSSIATGDESVLDLITSLVKKSLVVAETTVQPTRYRFLESTRAFASEKLAESGDQAALSEKHAAWALTFVRASGARSGAPLASFMTRVTQDLENLRQALRWSFSEQGDARLGAALAAALAPMWFFAGRVGEGKYWLETALARIDETQAFALAADLRLGMAHLSSGAGAAEAACRAQELYERLGSREGAARAMAIRATSLKQMGRLDDAAAMAEDALHVWRELKKANSYEYASAVNSRATIMAALGKVDEARSCYADVLRTFESIGDDEAAAVGRANLAELEFATGNYQRALELAMAAVARLAEMRSEARRAFYLSNVAGYHVALGEWQEARAKALEAVDLGQGFEGEMLAQAAGHLAAADAQLGDVRRGAILCGYVDRWYNDAGFERGPTEQSSRDILMNSLRVRLSTAEIEALAAEGAAMAEQTVVEEALALRDTLQ